MFMWLTVQKSKHTPDPVFVTLTETTHAFTGGFRIRSLSLALFLQEMMPANLALD